MKWEPHYTGIDTSSNDACGVNLYMNRNSVTRRIEFVRVSNAWSYRAWLRPSFMLGAFIYRTNHNGARPGFELFTGSVWCGWCDDPTRAVRWSGSIVKPYASITFSIGRAFLGCRTPEFVQDMMMRRDARRWEADEAARYAARSPDDIAEEEAEAAYYATQYNERSER